MKMLKLFNLIFLISLYGCSSSNYIITDDYKSQKLNSSLFVVAPFSVNIVNKEQCNKDLDSERAEDILINIVAEMFPKAAKKQWRIDSVYFANKTTNIEFENRELLINESDTIEMKLPTSAGYEAHAQTPAPSGGEAGRQ